MVVRKETAGGLENIGRIPVFRTLNDRYLALLSSLLARRQVRKGEALYQEGQPCDKFVVVLEGRFNLLKTSTEGREKVVAEIGPGQHFGLAEILAGRRSNATIEATEPGVVLTLSKDDFVRLLLDNPRMCFQLMRTMAATILRLSNQIQEVSFERVSVRLARLLLTLADREGTRVGLHVRIQQRYSHQELAKRLGASRETVTRMLKRFKDLGLVKSDGRLLVLADREGMLELIERGGVELEEFVRQ